ncbi:MAG: alpha-L-arabinofuranosidase C-terminal domain-containing protein [Bacteroidia bacterium]
MKRIITSLLFVSMSIISLSVKAQVSQTPLKIDLSVKGADVQPTMWGLFFEDINFAADGGLYAEKLKNYSFEFDNPMMGWNRVEENQANGYTYAMSYTVAGPNKKYIQLKRLNAIGTLGLQNSGFRGIGLQKGETYRLTFQARKVSGNAQLVAQLIGSEKALLGTAVQKQLTSEWTGYELSIPCSETDKNARFRLLIEGEGTIDVDMVSLFPYSTWKDRKRGMRKDIVQLLADMQPGFLRFPGGCIVEGFDLENRYQWKKTIGDMAGREVRVNRWNTEFGHRPTPDYYQSFGIGFFEYFQLAEDIGAAPLPILSCGLACQFNSGEIVQMGADLEPYIQDAVDLIEFANAPANTQWGSVRAEMGHPAPFNLRFIGVGNENWGPQYIERAKAFAEVIKARYPDVTIVSTSGPSPEGKEFDYLWGELKKMNAEIIDEHYYRQPEWFRENANRYDKYDRNGPKVFAGEYAAQSVFTVSPDNQNNWNCALSEAAFMTGLERNADVVHMASYAPLLAHVDAWQWKPDLIWFDNLSAFGTPNYYVQKMFSTNRGSYVVPVTHDNHSVSGQDNLFASAVVDTATHELIVKIVNTAQNSRKINIDLAGKFKLAAKGTITEMAADDLAVINSIEEPQKIAPAESEFEPGKKSLVIEVKGQSFSVAKIKIK